MVVDTKGETIFVRTVDRTTNARYKYLERQVDLWDATLWREAQLVRALKYIFATEYARHALQRSAALFNASVITGRHWTEEEIFIPRKGFEPEIPQYAEAYSLRLCFVMPHSDGEVLNGLSEVSLSLSSPHPALHTDFIIFYHVLLFLFVCYHKLWCLSCFHLLEWRLLYVWGGKLLFYNGFWCIVHLFTHS